MLLLINNDNLYDNSTKREKFQLKWRRFLKIQEDGVLSCVASHAVVFNETVL